MGGALIAPLSHKKMKVRVAPNLTVSEWTDPVSGIIFTKDAGDIEVPFTVDCSNIKRWVVQNYLIVATGSFEDLEKERRRMELHMKNEEQQQRRTEGIKQEASAALEKERAKVINNPEQTEDALRKVGNVSDQSSEPVETKKRGRKKKTDQ